MKSMQTILILAIFPIVILACGEINDNTVINDVVNPEPKPVKPNLSPPTIKHIVVPDQVHAGAEIKLEAFAEDPDGNTLTYNWEAPGKFLYNKVMSIAIWTAPIDLGVATINLTVNDGIHEHKQSVDVHVIPALIVPGQEAAGIRLGARHNDVIDIYGEPSYQANVAELELAGHQFPEWDTKTDWNNHGLTVYLRNSRVFAIIIGAPNTAITAAGNGIGTECDQIRDEMDKKFGRNLKGGGGNDVGYYAYIWDDHGIEIRCQLDDWENWHRSADPENPIVYQIVISKARPESDDPFGWPRLGAEFSK